MSAPEMTVSLQESPKEGRKFDDGKTQWSLLPWEGLEDIVRILMLGAKKYAPENWKYVPNARERYINALLRHFIAWSFLGERYDPESGYSHLAHTGCCLLFLMWLEKHPQEEK